MDTDKAQKFVQLNARKKELQAQLREVKDEMKELDQELQEEMLQSGIQNMKVQADGVESPYTVYIQTKKWASPLDKRQATQVLLDHGYDYMVGPQSQSVSKLFREEEDSLPEEIREAFNVTEKVKIKARKS